MTFDIDSGIFIGFLLINLVVGIYYSRGIKDIKEYSIGNRTFSTGSISATIAATFIGGGSFSIWTSGVYKSGLYYMWLGVCDVLTFYVICYVIAPRCGEFIGSVSIASAMEKLYGPKARTITAILGLLRTSGAIAIQFKMAAILLSYTFGDFGNELMILGAVVIIIYSSLGGIKAVVMTDVVQLLTFAVFIPVLGFIIWNNVEIKDVINTLNSNPNFNYQIVFNFNNYQEWFNFILISMVFLLPGLDPAIFQRISMATSVRQMKRSFFWAAFCVLLITLLTYWVAVLLLTEPVQLDPDKLIPYLLENYTHIGFRGIILTGIMAILISTADSYLNATSVLFANDLIKPLGFIHSHKLDLIISRISSVIVGVIAIILAVAIKDMLELILFIASFYMPIVTAPLYLAIFGFRSSFRCIVAGMITGASTSLLFHLYKFSLDPTILAMLANILVVFITHYISNESGGWVGIKDQISLEQTRQERRKNFYNFVAFLKQFSLLEFFKSNTPRQESVFFSFGLFAMVSVFCVIHSIPKEIQSHYLWMSELIFSTVLIFAAIFLSYPAWPERFKSANIIAIIWNIGVPYIMVFSSCLLVTLSNFSQLPMMIFMVNLIIIAALIRWQAVLLMLVIGVYVAVIVFKLATGLTVLPNNNIELQFKFIYGLLLTTSSLLMFFKPKQEYQELTEEKNTHLKGRLDFQEHELQEAQNLKAEFLRNISHEYNTPMTGVLSTAEVLYEYYDKLPEEKRKNAIESIFRSAARLDCFDNNIRILSGLSKGKLKLKKEEVDLSNLVLTRIAVCQKLYDEKPENHDFIINIQDSIKLIGDKEHLTRAIDNLIINAIQYCKNGKIEINLKEDDGKVLFKISDEGIGIPESELRTIFDEFKVSSKTHTPAGGRGVGLTVTQKIIELHRGSIKAQSDGIKGAAFSFEIPV